MSRKCQAVAIAGLVVATTLILLPYSTPYWVSAQDNTENNETPTVSLKGVSLFKYGQNGSSWSVKGKNATITEKVTLVHSFSLFFEEETAGTTSKPGRTLTLKGKTLQIHKGEYYLKIPGHVEFTQAESLSGNARNAIWRPTDNIISGEQFQGTLLASSRKGGWSVRGSRFTFNPETDTLNLEKGFQFRATSTEDGKKVKISGSHLQWESGGDVVMKGSLKGQINGNWKVNADEIVWDNSHQRYKGSGSLLLTKPGTMIRGESFSYSPKNNSLVVEDKTHLQLNPGQLD